MARKKKEEIKEEVKEEVIVETPTDETTEKVVDTKLQNIIFAMERDLAKINEDIETSDDEEKIKSLTGFKEFLENKIKFYKEKL